MTRLSGARLVRLLAHPLPRSSPVSKLSLFLSFLWLSVELTDGRGERSGWARSQVIRPWESLALHNSFNILWCKVLFTVCMSNIPLHSYILWCPFVNGDNLTLKMRTLHLDNIKIWKEIGLLLFFSCSLLSCFFCGGRRGCRIVNHVQNIILSQQ